MARTFTWETWRRDGQAPDRLELASAILAGAIGALRAAGFSPEEIAALFAETTPDRLGVALTRLAGGERRVGL